MLGTHDLPAFFLGCVFLTISPGPNTMFILTRSISLGLRAGLLSVLGTGTGVLVHTCFAAFGLSALLATSAVAFGAVKSVGALYLVYLGIRTLRRPPRNFAASGGEVAVPWRIYRQGVVTNLLNPNVALFFLAFLPQFVDSGANLGSVPFLVLGGVYVLGQTLWSCGLALSAARATRAIRSNPRAMAWLDRLSGFMYIGLGLNLLRTRPRLA